MFTVYKTPEKARPAKDGLCERANKLHCEARRLAKRTAVTSGADMRVPGNIMNRYDAHLHNDDDVPMPENDENVDNQEEEQTEEEMDIEERNAPQTDAEWLFEDLENSRNRLRM